MTALLENNQGRESGFLPLLKSCFRIIYNTERIQQDTICCCEGRGSDNPACNLNSTASNEINTLDFGSGFQPALMPEGNQKISLTDRHQAAIRSACKSSGVLGADNGDKDWGLFRSAALRHFRQSASVLSRLWPLSQRSKSAATTSSARRGFRMTGLLENYRVRDGRNPDVLKSWIRIIYKRKCKC